MYPNNPDRLGSLEEQIARALVFCQAYGLSNEERLKLPALMIERLQALIKFMQEQAENGNKTMLSHMQNGHHLLYLSDIAYIKENLNVIEDGLWK